MRLRGIWHSKKKAPKMDDLLTEFLTETNESIETVDTELVRLERDPNDKPVLDNIFRLVHTIKGTCGFLGLPRLEAVAHAAETMLGEFRDGKIKVTPDRVTLILQALDCIKVILGTLEKTAKEPDGNDSALIAKLEAAARGATVTHDAEPDAEIDLEAMFAAPVAKAADDASASDDGSQKNNQTIRVSVTLLEDLMNLVSELVLTRNQLTQMVRKAENTELAGPIQRLSQCTTELQEGVMKTRMQPIGNAWAKLPRVVRDLGQELKKKIDIDMRGAETELDRQVLELIKDPLTHMVRNSADHGIELPAVRAAAGKPETGRIVLNAYHEGGQIVIEISDDGRGLNLERLREKAVQSGLVSAAEAETMSDSHVQKFIFHPGLSTADAITSVSGRGVGMDVVKSNIEKIGGTIEVTSNTGRGTRFAIKIPLTLAIVSSLIVAASKERFAIPQISVLELVRAAADSDYQIERINETPVLRLRNRLLPLVFLNDILKLPNKADATEVFVVVSQVGSFTFGIVVDQVFDTEEIVVKPVAPILKHLSVYSGNTILGDGSVIMILDPNGIANAVTKIEHDTEEAIHTLAANDSSLVEHENMLVFHAGDTVPKAVPLSLVARLEELPLEQIEYAEGRPMVQYRGSLMPLVFVDAHCKLRTEGRQPVLVFVDGGMSMGIAVDEINDIVDAALNIELLADRSGRVGTAVVAGKVTEVLDVGYYFSLAFKDFLKLGDQAKETQAQRRRSHKQLLLVDDSSFFRTMLKPLLHAAGYQVTAVSDAQAALALREEGREFDIIVSDIEMPGLSGFEFAEAIRSSGKWSGTPLVALSSLTRPSDIERGRKAGFDDYVAKFDREQLVTVIDEQLNLSVRAA
jgi:two-component system, chemotaxis family, sensor kinase CheA